MDSFKMDPMPQFLRFRLVRLNEQTLDVGSYVLVAARHVANGNVPRFPAQLEVQVDNGPWTAVQFVNASLVDDEDETPK